MTTKLSGKILIIDSTVGLIAVDYVPRSIFTVAEEALQVAEGARLSNWLQGIYSHRLLLGLG